MDLFAAENELNAWSPDELLFREYRLVQNGQFPLEMFLEKYKHDERNLGYALHPENISKLHAESTFLRIETQHLYPQASALSSAVLPCSRVFRDVLRLLRSLRTAFGRPNGHTRARRPLSHGSECDSRNRS